MTLISFLTPQASGCSLGSCGISRERSSMTGLNSLRKSTNPMPYVRRQFYKSFREDQPVSAFLCGGTTAAQVTRSHRESEPPLWSRPSVPGRARRGRDAAIVAVRRTVERLTISTISAVICFMSVADVWQQLLVQPPSAGPVAHPHSADVRPGEVINDGEVPSARHVVHAD